MPAAKTTTKKSAPAKKAPRRKPAAKRKTAPKRKVSRARRVKTMETTVSLRDPFAFLADAKAMPEPPALQPQPVPEDKTTPLPPTIDLDSLPMHLDPVPAQTPAPGEEVALTWRSRMSFYLGVFFGAIVVHVLVVALLAIVSV